MMNRRLGREIALKVLYQHDMAGGDPIRAIGFVCDEEGAPAQAREFARELIEGTLAQRKGIDDCIASYARDWRLERLAPVDRNILRLAIFEILYRSDIPHGVSVNEAVEMAKAYGEEESGRFINGILGQIIKDCIREEGGSQDSGSHN